MGAISAGSERTCGTFFTDGYHCHTPSGLFMGFFHSELLKLLELLNFSP